MASGLVNQHSNVGFYKAPVSKGLLVLIGGSHASTHVPAFSHLFKRIFLTGRLSNVDSVEAVVRLVASKLVFPDIKNTALALVLVYFFRIFERRYGSLKFSSNLLVCWSLGVSLELLVSPLAGLPPSTGPLALVLPLVVPYYLQVPALHHSRFGPLRVSPKWLPYLLAAQLCLSSPSCLLAGVLSLVAGLFTFLTPLSSLCLPCPLAKLASLTLGPLFQSSPPPQGSLMGATLEIQRTQQAEALEEQLLRSRQRFNVPIGGRQMRLDEFWQQGGVGGIQRRGPAAAPAPPPLEEPIPELVAALTDMGFPRERVEQALREASNDIDQATNLLLREI